MGASPISWLALGALYLLLLLPVILFRLFQLELGRDLLISVSRMTAQLLLVGLYLGWLFRYDNPLLNLLWFCVMLITAAFAVVGRAKLSRKQLLKPVICGLIAGCAVTLPALLLVTGAEPLFNSRYLIPLAGMLLGNSMNASVIALERLFSALHQEQELYAARLALGASVRQAVLPYQQAALTAGFSPSLASMATMGLVTLPGMMTGQLLSGTSPMTAIQYQLVINIGIFCCLTVASWAATSLALHWLIDPNGRVKTLDQQAGHRPS